MKTRTYRKQISDATGERVIAIHRRLAQSTEKAIERGSYRILKLFGQRLLYSLGVKQQEVIPFVLEDTFNDGVELFYRELLGPETIAAEVGITASSTLYEFLATPTIIETVQGQLPRLADKRTRFLAKEVVDVSRKVVRSKLLAGGSNIPEIVRGIQDSGVFSRNRAIKIARTESIHMLNQGQLEVWKTGDIVKEVEWFTAGDERVCPICRQLHGKTAKLFDNFNPLLPDILQFPSPTTGNLRTINVARGTFANSSSPPIHGLCRCTLIPIV